MVSRLKTYGFLRLNSFFILSPFSPLAVPLYSYRERRTTISPLNPFAPGVFSLRIRQDYRSYCIFLFFCLDFIGFLMRQPHDIRGIGGFSAKFFRFRGVRRTRVRRVSKTEKRYFLNYRMQAVPLSVSETVCVSVLTPSLTSISYSPKKPRKEISPSQSHARFVRHS